MSLFSFGQLGLIEKRNHFSVVETVSREVMIFMIILSEVEGNNLDLPRVRFPTYL